MDEANIPVKKKEGGRIFKRHKKASALFPADGRARAGKYIFLSACLPPSQTKDALLKILRMSNRMTT